MKWITNIIVLLIWVVISMPSLSHGDFINYYYDDAGRLVRAVNGAEGSIYQYDRTGNLLSITVETISQSPPLLQSISPHVLFIGSTTTVIISGQNLFTTKNISSDDPNLEIRTLDVTDSEIQLDITVSSSALPGNVNITVTTEYGSANIQATLTASKLFFSPGQLALIPNSSGNITANISPSIGEAISIRISNSSPSIVTAPQALIVPASGSAVFSVNALTEGTALLSSGDTRATVFVSAPFAPGPDEPITSKSGPVSVAVLPDTSNADVVSTASPVSVYISTPQTDNVFVTSLPVSSYIETATGDSTISSPPASAYIETAQGTSTVSALPLSVYVETSSLFATSTIAVLPVNVLVLAAGDNAVAVSPLISAAVCQNQPVRVVGSSTTYYITLQAAYNSASDGDTIQGQAVTLTGDLNINLNKSVAIEGGYDCGFAMITGKTLLRGTMTISDGILTIENFSLEE